MRIRKNEANKATIGKIITLKNIVKMIEDMEGNFL
ncbi:hypothetical protein T11_10553 [Trichinella zimbabwensis]|uniref:Uncharacterized protein n=1 Tax=Trichinella zimbabwensis TaxID=268475 RepID=A0A0V1DR22_9BILA|nr:hypothetical protein T11_10553 [Trichinella zimbabwensis]